MARQADASKRVVRRMGWALAIIAGIALVPVLFGLSAGGVAALFGCELNEGNPQPCVVAGVDIGLPLYQMGLMVWLMLFTMPAAALAFSVWLIVALGLGARWVWRQRAAKKV